MAKTVDRDTRRGAPFARNELGRLDARAKNDFIGSRLMPDGTYETRIFHGQRDECVSRWVRWQRDSFGIAKAAADKHRKEAASAAAGKEVRMATAEKQKAGERKCYILRFVNGANVKDVAAFMSQDKALEMAVALGAALEATGMGGEYQADELPVWGE